MGKPNATHFPLPESTFMRSSKSRSRGKNRNNNRPSGGNIINRVFDSSGPDGKVRGTPQQIIEKYNQLHRDAQLSGDRVAAENFAQHAEHYLRILAEAQREVDKAREEQEEQNRQRQAERDRERADRLKAQEEQAAGAGEQPDVSEDRSERPQREDRPHREARRPRREDVIETPSEDEDDNGLVETPESKAPEAEEPKKAPRKPRAPRKPQAKADSTPDDSAAAAE